jgi:hypothetical protein
MKITSHVRVGMRLSLVIFSAFLNFVWTKIVFFRVKNDKKNYRRYKRFERPSSLSLQKGVRVEKIATCPKDSFKM